MKTIKLSNAQITLVDDEDWIYLSKYKWHLSNGYVYRSYKECGEQRHISMHREIMNFPNKKDVDHINGNRLDNRKHNLRTATRAQNMRNRGKVKRNKSGYKGVFEVGVGGKWSARIKTDDKLIYLGIFSDKESAARAYDLAAIEFHKEFANLNFEAES